MTDPAEPKRVVSARSLVGEVHVPSDKSLTHRAVLISSLGDGESIIENPLEAADCLSTVNCVEQLGVAVKRQPGRWKIKGKGLWSYRAPNAPLDCGNSGTTMRLISGLLAAQSFSSTLIGDASLSKRPMGRVASPLEAMGAKFAMTEGQYAPMKIQGNRPLRPIRWTSPIASAQVKSAVLFAGLHAMGQTSFEEPARSRDHTERMLQACGAAIQRSATTVSVTGPAKLQPMHWRIPGDFSSAAFFLVAGVLVPAPKIYLSNVNFNPTRSGLAGVLQRMGARFSLRNKQIIGGEDVADISVEQTSSLTAIDVGAEEIPAMIDEVPILSVLATQAKGTTRIRGIKELRVKESDRIAAMAQNLARMGADVKEEPDGLIVRGPTVLKGTTVPSWADHRIAMSMAVAGLVATGETFIQEPDSVGISFPGFWEILDRLHRP